MIIEPKNERIYLYDFSLKGCEQNVKNQIDYINSKRAVRRKKKWLVEHLGWFGFKNNKCI
jgi:trans-2-enoyl-CoA reductase